MKHSSPYWSFHSREYHPHMESVPGPGAYSPTSSFLHSSPQYRVGTAQRPELTLDNLNPGPGSYDPRSAISTPSWSMSGRTGRESGMKTFENSLFGSTRAPFSQSSGRPQTKENIKSVSSAGKNAEIAKVSNMFSITGGEYRRKSVPGPGEYELAIKKDGPFYSFRPKIQVKLKECVPGPGNYQPKSSFVQEKAPAWPTGRSEKPIRQVSKDACESPGPGSYMKVFKTDGPQWRFGSSKRTASSTSRVPGPGSYEIASAVGNPPPYVRIQF